MSPGLLLIVVTAFCAIAAGLTIAVATSQPWLGVSLATDPVRDGIYIGSVAESGPAKAAGVVPGMRLVEIGPAPASANNAAARTWLLPSDLAEDPDGLPSYSDVSTFMDRQTRLTNTLSETPVALHLLDDLTGTATVVVVRPQGRPVLELPAVFWFQLFSAVAGLLIGVWVWALRRNDTGAIMFALSGLGLFLSAMPAAIYSTRELAIDGNMFRSLSALNHFGAHLFGGAMIALFLNYPRRLLRPIWLLALPGVLLAWFMADIAHWLPGPVVGMYVPMLTQMATIIGLVAVQWRLAKGDPVTLAALRWLGLSVIVGAGAFCAGIAVPLLLGAEPAISQGYAFTFFLLVYGGIALGIRRYRLFELGDWAFRILFYAGAAAMLLTLDAILIGLIHIDHGPALAASLLIVSFAYLPLRDGLWRRMNRRAQLQDHELFAEMTEVAFALTPSEQTDLWRKLLVRLFDPLELIPAARNVSEVSAEADGLDLMVPAAASSTALRLRYPFAGKGLFGPQQVMLARQLTGLLEQAETARKAYERGVLEERHRIARDLHDDVGARLLTGLNTADGTTRPILHAAMSDIRAIISGLTGASASLDRILAEARYETANRLQAVGIGLEWTVPDESTSTIIFDYRQSKALVSSIREVISNVLRHAQAKCVRTELVVSDAEIVLSIADDGDGISGAYESDGPVSGFGLSNIRRRIEEVGGRLTIQSAREGVRIVIVLPLNSGTRSGRAKAGLPRQEKFSDQLM